jgi:hypothetical protein
VEEVGKAIESKLIYSIIIPKLILSFALGKARREEA